MSAYVRLVLSREIRASIAAAYSAMSQEAARQAEEKRLTASVERNLRDLDRVAKESAEETLKEMNRQNLAKLAAWANQPDPPEATLTQQPPEPVAQKKELPTTERKVDPAPTPPRPEPATSAQTTHKILGYLAELRKLSPQAAQTKAALLAELGQNPPQERLEMIADSTRLALAREIAEAARAHGRQAELRALAQALQPLPEARDLVARIQALTQARVSPPESLAEIRERARIYLDQANQKDEELFLHQATALTEKLLAQQGYKVLNADGLPVGQDRFFSNGQPGYRVLARLERDGALTLRHLKVVPSREVANQEPTALELAQDLEKTTAWCQAQEKLAASLTTAGLRVQTEILRQAGEGRLPALIEKNQPPPAQKSQKKALLTAARKSD
ncbi:MAG: hypothetical protein LBR11_03975 [Deltaproteobacteria bacterium]|jgi:hypothetical protein|nr:hypothetical protein [Deltaproteobacteria bacterium]